MLAALVAIELRGMEDVTTYHGKPSLSWAILETNCIARPNLEVIADRDDIESCELEIGRSYTLQCESYNGQWWMSNHIVIEDSIYCKYTKGKRLVNITISGNTHHSCSIWSSYLNIINLIFHSIFITLQYLFLYIRGRSSEVSY